MNTGQTSAGLMFFGTLILLIDALAVSTGREEGRFLGFVHRHVWFGWSALTVSAICAFIDA